MAKWVTIKMFTNRLEAELAKSVLDSCGIRAQILSDDFSGSHPHLQMIQGVKLQVIDEEANEALEVLAAGYRDK